MKYTIFPILIIAAIVGFLVYSKNKMPSESPQIDAQTMGEEARISFSGMAATKGVTDLSIQPNQVISGIYKLTGKVQGYMFEGTFPIKIVSPTNDIVWSGFGKVVDGEEWMTAEPVKFSAEIDTTGIQNGTYTMILTQEDASGERTDLKSLDISFVITN